MNPATCKHEDINRRFETVSSPEFIYFCADCGLQGDSPEDIRGEGTIEAQIEDEQDKREQQLTELGRTLAATPEELFQLMDEKMFRQIMGGFITIKLRPHQQLIGYFILSIQNKDVAFVPDPEEGCRFAAAVMLKAANVIPKLRVLDNQELVQGNGHNNLIKIVH